MSNQPEYEIRAAVVPGSDGVEVVYRHVYGPDVVDLIWVTRPTAAPPPTDA